MAEYQFKRALQVSCLIDILPCCPRGTSEDLESMLSGSHHPASGCGGNSSKPLCQMQLETHAIPTRLCWSVAAGVHTACPHDLCRPAAA